MKHAQFEDSALLEAWLREPTWLEAVDEGRVSAIVQQTPQVRRWPPQLDLGRFTPMLNATKFVAASVILALTGALLLNVMPSEPLPLEPIPAAETATAEEPTEAATERPVTTDLETPIITLPDELPDRAESGDLDTPAGPATWVHVTANDGSLPPFIETLVPWGDGIANWEDYLGLLHTTTDGVTWERQDHPFEHGTMSYLDGQYVVVEPSPDRVWISTDPRSGWAELDASAMEAARLTGWETRYRRVGIGPLLVGGRVIFTIDEDYMIPRKKLGISLSGTKKLHHLPDDRFALCGGGGCPNGGSKWVIRLDETPKGLEVVLDETGKRLGLIKDATAGEVYKGEMGTRHSVFAIEGDTVIEIDSPWPGLGPSQVSNRMVAPQGTELVLRRWKSDGSADPRRDGLPEFAGEVPRSHRVTTWRFPDRLEAHAYSTDSRAPWERAWVSVDGVDWEPAPPGVPMGAVARWTGSGWLATRGGPGGNERWMHLGGEWISLESMAINEVPAYSGQNGLGGLAGVTLFVLPRDERSGDLWVLAHPPEME